MLSDSMPHSYASLCESLSCSDSELKTALEQLCNQGLDLAVEKDCVQGQFDAFDRVWIAKQLQSISKSLNFRFEVSSTNELVKRTDSIGLTEFQSAGYGRYQRQWQSPMGGGLPISINHRFDLPLEKLSGLSLMVGYQLVKILNKHSAHEFKIKWPNDVLGNDGKVSGILIQAKPAGGDHTEVIIGIGVNWKVSQRLLDSLEYPCMNAGVQKLSKSEFVVELIQAVEKGLQKFKISGLNSILDDWSQFDAFDQQQVQVSDGSHSIHGRNQGIDSLGSLKLLTDDGLLSFHNGEVSLRKVDF